MTQANRKRPTIASTLAVRAREALARLVEVLAPQPQPVPVPVRTGRTRPRG